MLEVMAWPNLKCFPHPWIVKQKGTKCHDTLSDQSWPECMSVATPEESSTKIIYQVSMKKQIPLLLDFKTPLQMRLTCTWGKW